MSAFRTVPEMLFMILPLLLVWPVFSMLNSFALFSVFLGNSSTTHLSNMCALRSVLNPPKRWSGSSTHRSLLPLV